MFVILKPETYELRLGQWSSNGDNISALLRPYQASLMSSHPVSKRVNNVRGDDAACAAHINLSLPVDF
jgi:putative SOS response-associated peptidase YedK